MRKHFLSIAFAALAMAAALGAYIVNLRVSAERAEVEALQGSIARDMADIAALQAELRTRARLPQLEQWNAVAWRLAAPGPQQLLGAPVMLAAYSPVQREAAVRAGLAAAADATAAAQAASAVLPDAPDSVRRPLVIVRAGPPAGFGAEPAAGAGREPASGRAPGAQIAPTVIAAQIAEAPLSRVAGTLDSLGRADLESLGARARANQAATTTAALGPR